VHWAGVQSLMRNSRIKDAGEHKMRDSLLFDALMKTSLMRLVVELLARCTKLK